jgi:hypothetical protein
VESGWRVGVVWVGVWMEYGCGVRVSVCQCVGVSMCGCVGVCVCACVGVWVCGCVDVGVRVGVGVNVRFACSARAHAMLCTGWCV